MRRTIRYELLIAATFGLTMATPLAQAADSSDAVPPIRLLRMKLDPYGYPRPAPGAVDVPVGTSLFFELGFDDKQTNDAVLEDSVAVRIEAEGVSPIELLRPRRRFADGYHGKFTADKRRGSALAVYIDGGVGLRPSTTYTVTVAARSRNGGVLRPAAGTWRFTTAAAATSHALRFRLDTSKPAVRWHGGFFTGFCKPSFCTSASNRIKGYELMDAVRKRYPKAWSLQRDFTMTGMEHQPRFLSNRPPNVVRERETRRIVAIERRERGTLLSVEDFFGHRQYGIASGRPLADDYHPSDEVLIADGVSHARAKVLAVVDDSADARSLLVTLLDEPPAGWKLAYSGPLPEAEDPAAPGLFPPGGCYLRKFRPAGTPCYYWGRLDKEWDIAHRRFGRRLVVNFAEAPGDLSVDGGNWTYPKDYAEYHRVVRAYTTHLIERYGDACLDFTWSVFNEPDLARLFWRSGDWDELQRFYDYTVDGILRSFEEAGYDSRRVMVGGLEIGAIFGTHIEGPVLKRFLTHCSPTATHADALPQNAAFADRRLDGQRSRRVEGLCRKHDGRGSPCDFISIHSYNESRMTAAKLARAKQLALQIDADYYDDLWVSSFESCPNWAPPPDVAAADSYLGNGYFPTWCADVTRRQLQQAADDGRYAFGETILTFWPWPNQGFGGHNAATRVIPVDEDGDGKPDREETVAMPILHFLGLLSSMGDEYRVLPEQTVGGHVVSGFASVGEKSASVLLYSHHAYDVESRSRATFQITLDVGPLPWREVRVREYRFDKDHNSYYRLGRKLRENPGGGASLRRCRPGEVDELIAALTSDDLQAQLAAIRRAATLRDLPGEVLMAASKLHEQTPHDEIRTAIETAAAEIQARKPCYGVEEVDRVRELSQLRVTGESRHTVGADEMLRLPVALAANGADFIVVEPQRAQR